MDVASVTIEAIIFMAIIVATSFLVCALLPRLSPRGFVRARFVTVARSTFVSFIATELWTQLSQRPRYARITLLICFITAGLATVAQSSNREDRARFRP